MWQWSQTPQAQKKKKKDPYLLFCVHSTSHSKHNCHRGEIAKADIALLKIDGSVITTCSILYTSKLFRIKAAVLNLELEYTCALLCRDDWKHCGGWLRQNSDIVSWLHVHPEILDEFAAKMRHKYRDAAFECHYGLISKPTQVAKELSSRCRQVIRNRRDDVSSCFWQCDVACKVSQEN